MRGAGVAAVASDRCPRRCLDQENGRSRAKTEGETEGVEGKEVKGIGVGTYSSV